MSLERRTSIWIDPVFAFDLEGESFCLGILNHATQRVFVACSGVQAWIPASQLGFGQARARLGTLVHEC